MQVGTRTYTMRELYNQAVEGTYYDTDHRKRNTPKGQSDGHYETSRRYLDDLAKKSRRQTPSS